MTTIRPPLKKVVDVVKSTAKPAAKPATTPAARKFANEFSTGKGGALRANAARLLPSAVNAFQNPAAVPSKVAASAPPEVQQQASEILKYLSPSPEALAYQLEAASPEVRDELLRQIMATDNPEIWLGGQGMSSPPNAAFDNAAVIGEALNHAYRSGAVTDADLRKVAENWGPEFTEIMVQSFALGRNATGTNGIVEALGVQAQQLGFDRAAALAFSSSDVLLKKHYPTPDAQRAAFAHVKSFLEDYDQDAGYFKDLPETRNAIGGALVAAARFTSLGTGYSPAELDEELKELGSEYVSEAIAQHGDTPANITANGPLAVLGDSAARLSSTWNDPNWKPPAEADEWALAASTAYTQSPALIEAKLSDPATRLKAFDVLNAFLADNRGEWGSANHHGYSLVRLPQAAEGLNLLLGAHPEMISEILDRGPAGQADLVQLFESIALNPEVPASERQRLQRNVEAYIEQEVANMTSATAPIVSARIGTLLATLQVAGNRAVEHSNAPDDKVKGFLKDFVAGIVGTAANAGLAAVTGPIGGAVGGVILDQVLGEIFKDDPPARAEIEKAFADRLRAAGIDVGAGALGRDELLEVYRALEGALNDALDKETNPTRKAELESQLRVVDSFLDELDSGYGNTIDDSTGGGPLATELNNRGDEP